MEGAGTQKDPLERIADALEKLASEPDEIELEMGPPICPACGKLNPVITVPEQQEQSGPMVELVTIARCDNCGSQLFIVIESYSVHKEITTATEEIQARRAGMK